MAAHLPRQPMRSLLGVEDEHYVAILRDPGKVNDESGAVFYFPAAVSARAGGRAYRSGSGTVGSSGCCCEGRRGDETAVLGGRILAVRRRARGQSFGLGAGDEARGPAR